MPLVAAEHGHKAIEAFLWGLLPDNATVLDRWTRRFQVSARSPFALMSHVGEDCAGAVQFVRPERFDDVVGQGSSEIDWLDEAGVAEAPKKKEAHAHSHGGMGDMGGMGM